MFEPADGVWIFDPIPMTESLGGNIERAARANIRVTIFALRSRDSRPGRVFDPIQVTETAHIPVGVGAATVVGLLSTGWRRLRDPRVSGRAAGRAATA